MKLFIAALWLMASPAIIGAYTFESSIDPIDFFGNYYPVGIHQFNESQAMLMLKSETFNPRYALNFVEVADGQMRILGYAYIENGELKRYVLVEGVYKRSYTPPDVEANLKKILEGLHEKDKEAEEDATESPKTPGSYEGKNRQDC